MMNFKRWVRANQVTLDIPAKEVQFLLDEININELSIKAGNIFPVTYSLAASVSYRYYILLV